MMDFQTNEFEPVDVSNDPVTLQKVLDHWPTVAEAADMLGLHVQAVYLNIYKKRYPVAVVNPLAEPPDEKYRVDPDFLSERIDEQRRYGNWYSVPHVATALGVSEVTVRKMCERGDLNAVRRYNNRIVIDPAQVDEKIAEIETEVRRARRQVLGSE